MGVTKLKIYKVALLRWNMAKQKLEEKVIEQVICPDCGNTIDYNEIDKYKISSPADLMEMRFYDFVDINFGKTKEKIRHGNLRWLHGGVWRKKMRERYGPRWKEMNLNRERKNGEAARVKDLYRLKRGEIYSIPGAGPKTWRVVNEMLELNKLPVLKLPKKYYHA